MALCSRLYDILRSKASLVLDQKLCNCRCSPREASPESTVSRENTICTSVVGSIEGLTRKQVMNNEYHLPSKGAEAALIAGDYPASTYANHYPPKALLYSGQGTYLGIMHLQEAERSIPRRVLLLIHHYTCRREQKRRVCNRPLRSRDR